MYIRHLVSRIRLAYIDVIEINVFFRLYGISVTYTISSGLFVILIRLHATQISQWLTGFLRATLSHYRMNCQLHTVRIFLYVFISKISFVFFRYYFRQRFFSLSLALSSTGIYLSLHFSVFPLHRVQLGKKYIRFSVKKIHTYTKTHNKAKESPNTYYSIGENTN